MTLSKGYKNLEEKIISTITTRKNENIYLTWEKCEDHYFYQHVTINCSKYTKRASS